MNIVLFFLFSIVLAYESYNRNKLGLLSPTLWSSVMAAIVSFIYICTYSSMSSDIHLNTLGILCGSLVVIWIGEYLAWHTVIFRCSNRVIQEKDGLKEITISKKVTIITFGALSLLAILDFRQLLNTINEIPLDPYAGKLNFIQTGRMVALSGETSTANVLVNQLRYVSEIIGYTYAFSFAYNTFISKKMLLSHLYLLLPLVPDFIIRFLSTGRAAFIRLIVAAMIGVFYAIMKKGRTRRIKIKFRYIFLLIIFGFFFITYGRLRDGKETSLVSYVQGYTCGAICAFDRLINENRLKSTFWGSFTLRLFYEEVGIHHDSYPIFLNMRYSKDGGITNIYTSLANSYLDFGVFGSYMYFFAFSYICSKIIAIFLKKLTSKNFITLLYFSVVSILCFMYWPLADLFCGSFLAPTMLIRYILYSWILGKFLVLGFRPKDSIHGS